MTLEYCLLTATKPSCVTKKYSLDQTGVLVKETSASVSEGKLQIMAINSVDEFAQNLLELSHDQCHIYGLPPHDAQLVTEDTWQKLGKPIDALPRTQDVFAWAKGPGIMLCDKDAPKGGSPSLTREQVLDTVITACPKVAEADHVWWPSASSHIFKDESDLTGLRGQHLYIFVSDASDIERAGNALNERLWAQGVGHYEISESGSLLKRSFFDSSVWQTNHIDFAAGAQCGEGLKQQRSCPVVAGRENFCFLDTRTAIPELTAEERRLALGNQKICKSALEEDARKQREIWTAKRVDQIKLGAPNVSVQRAASIVQRATERRELSGEFQIVVQVEGKELPVTVNEVLKDPGRFDGLLTLDPLEPDYDGRRFVGKLFVSGARPNLFSFAHGGTNYRLKHDVQQIEILQGRANLAIDGLLSVMRESQEIYDFGQKLVQIQDDGKLQQMTDHTLRYFAGGLVQFFKVVKQQNGPSYDLLVDPPINVCKAIVELKDGRKLKPLNGLITAPTLRADGSLLVSAGYDASTRLFFDQKNRFRSRISHAPSREDASKAIETLWAPFKDFPFCTALDRAVHLAALITAAVRAVLPSAPGFAYDAPIQGSGKTLLARCVGVLAQGAEPSVWPHTTNANDEEIRKRIFTVLTSGTRVLIWDNVVGTFDSAAVASSLTSPNYTDRILGKSDSTTVPNRMMFILTGNNIQLQGEMPRRVLISRIDPATDKPFSRDFEIDPFAVCRANRQEMVAASLTLIRGFLTHGCQSPIKGKLASFEEWDLWVRRAVLFANDLHSGMFGDVMQVVQANQSVDPEQETLVALLSAWHAVFGSKPVHASEVIQAATGINAIIEPHEKALKDALDVLPVRDARHISTKSLGRYLSYKRDRQVRGFCLRIGLRVSDKQTWYVECVQAPSSAGGV
jgi:hypothetical protein